MDVEENDIMVADPDSPEDFYPDWVDIPYHVHPKIVVNDHNGHYDSGYEELKVKNNVPMSVLQEMIAHRLGGLPHFIELCDQNGDAWIMTKKRRQHVLIGQSWI